MGKRRYTNFEEEIANYAASAAAEAQNCGPWRSVDDWIESERQNGEAERLAEIYHISVEAVWVRLEFTLREAGPYEVINAPALDEIEEMARDMASALLDLAREYVAFVEDRGGWQERALLERIEAGWTERFDTAPHARVALKKLLADLQCVL